MTIGPWSIHNPGRLSVLVERADRRRALGDWPKGSVLGWPERPGDSSPGLRPLGAAPGLDRAKRFCALEGRQSLWRPSRAPVGGGP